RLMVAPASSNMSKNRISRGIKVKRIDDILRNKIVEAGSRTSFSGGRHGSWCFHTLFTESSQRRHGKSAPRAFAWRRWHTRNESKGGTTRQACLTHAPRCPQRVPLARRFVHDRYGRRNRTCRRS